MINPLPLSLEVTSNETSEMFEQAELFAGWADNINVKITIHGPNGELNNLKVINQLENKKNIRVNVTAMMSAHNVILQLKLVQLMCLFLVVELIIWVMIQIRKYIF